jgi:hypothetical protein
VVSLCVPAELFGHLSFLVLECVRDVSEVGVGSCSVLLSGVHFM